MSKFKNVWIIPIVIIGFIIMFYIVKIDWQNFLKDYKEISLESKIDSRITYIIVKRGVGYIRLKTGDGYFFYTAKNYSYKPCEMHKFLNVGDSLSKKAYTDTIIVKRSSEEYIFAISRFLNE